MTIPIYAKVSNNSLKCIPIAFLYGGNSHINGIESFWGYAKIRLVKFKGMNKDMFKCHLKECEFRFNNRKQNLYKFLLGNFRKEPLN
jgi:transposase-like protein